ncbi:MAG: PIN domain-containing protein [Candidatus Micrarchaeota archaeon]
MSAIVDTCVLIAFHNASDEKHEAAVEFMRRASKGEFGKLLLLDCVFGECVTLSLARSNSAKARKLGEWLLSSGFELAYSDSQGFAEAWNLFQKRDSLSFTDCAIASAALKKDASVLTFDRHFAGVPKLRVVR